MYLGLDLACIALGQLLLAGSGDQDVTVSLQDVSFIRRRVREAHDGPVGLEMEKKPNCHWLVWNNDRQVTFNPPQEKQVQLGILMHKVTDVNYKNKRVT